MDNSVKTFIKKLQKKKEGFVNSEDGQRSIGYFKGLNSDYAHFIWEILQNAEDVHATEISFTLKDTHILIRHNGTPFTESNVEAICSILYSDRRLKKGKIGKFGAGFKTVFKYTDAPEVYSGMFSFKIIKLIYPEIIPSHPEYDSDTVFILPFINPKKAYSDISLKNQLVL